MFLGSVFFFFFFYFLSQTCECYGHACTKIMPQIWGGLIKTTMNSRVINVRSILLQGEISYWSNPHPLLVGGGYLGQYIDIYYA